MLAATKGIVVRKLVCSRFDMLAKLGVVRFIHPCDPNWHARKANDKRPKSSSFGVSRPLIGPIGPIGPISRIGNKSGLSRSNNSSLRDRIRLSPPVSQASSSHRRKVESDVGPALDYRRSVERSRSCPGDKNYSDHKATYHKQGYPGIHKMEYKSKYDSRDQEQPGMKTNVASKVRVHFMRSRQASFRSNFTQGLFKYKQ